MSKYIDVFNGDADGIFSLIQLRKSHPITAYDKQILITGVKRDIALVSKIDENLANDAQITVLDVSFDKNDKDVKRVLEHCQSLFYCDHHKADKLFEHKNLKTVINTEPTVCTGLLINNMLNDKNVLWAVAAIYGDGLDNVASEHVKRLGLTQTQCEQLKELGILVNYNGYGNSVADLYFDPADLYQRLVNYDNPFEVVNDSESPYQLLKQGYEADIAKADASEQLVDDDLIVVILEDAPWARRISGTYGNQLAATNLGKPVVIVTDNSKGSYAISLRAPKDNPYGASTICSQFNTGGGREGAAGINALPKNDLNKFVEVVRKYYT
ncbi:DHH family phosphoesterase [Psychrobacter sp. Ps2]|uniref:DHH family phosphoesterase n=1 Tax=Psychrobacter sp. Ps2 TaxID=2790956 RepID=UPI001EE01C47|nr:DHH family phosphoesterase [Psychrobacter sp. Ps2]MCG3858884.1 DHH family phosphoesterase [Psychrobacter sp. Ps2]